MNKLTLLLSFFTLIVFLGCTDKQIVELEKSVAPDHSTQDNNRETQATIRPLNSKENVLDLKLDQQFSISEKTYTEFINSIVFVEGNFKGCKYAGIEKELNDRESYEFWSYFGTNIRQLLDDGATFKDYRPKGSRGCKMNDSWICHLSGPVFKGIAASTSHVLQLRLDKQFDIPKEIYYEFVGSLIFENDRLRGCIYEGISTHLDKDKNQLFWAYFGVDFESQLTIDKGPILVAYKPQGSFNCKSNRRWICLQPTGD